MTTLAPTVIKTITAAEICDMGCSYRWVVAPQEKCSMAILKKQP